MQQPVTIIITTNIILIPITIILILLITVADDLLCKGAQCIIIITLIFHLSHPLNHQFNHLSHPHILPDHDDLLRSLVARGSSVHHYYYYHFITFIFILICIIIFILIFLLIMMTCCAGWLPEAARCIVNQLSKSNQLQNVVTMS